MTLKQYLNIELVKFKVPLNFITFGIYILLMIGAVFLISSESANITINGEGTGAGAGILLQLQVSFIRLLMAILIFFNVGREFATGTVKKNIIDGFSRANWITGKYLAGILIYVAVFVFGLVLYFGLGSAIGSFESTSEGYSLTQVLTDFSVYLYHTVMILAIAFITRKTVLSFIIFLFWPGFESTLNLLVSKATDGSFNIQQYLPYNAISFVKNGAMTDNLGLLIVPCIYFVLFFAVPFYLFKNKDIK